MKKILLSLGAMVLCAQMSAKDLHTIKSGAFVGFATGYSIGFEHGNAGLQVIAPRYLNVGAKLGYNLYFSKALGLRFYVDYIYGMNLHSSESGTNGSYLHYVNANVDLLLNFYESESVVFGSFVGLGAGYGVLKTQRDTAEALCYRSISGLASSLAGHIAWI